MSCVQGTPAAVNCRVNRTGNIRGRLAAMALQETTRTRGGGRYDGGRDGAGRTDDGRTDEMLARGLGWFSIGLGLAEVAAPRRLARLIGIEQDSGTIGVLRAFGVREIGNGIAILTQPRNPGWLWGRVGGDAMDLAFLGKQLSSDRAQRDRVAAAAAAVVGVT